MRTLPVFLLAGLLWGCGPDTRISLQQMEEMQGEIAARDPVPLRQMDIALAEVLRYRAQNGDVLGVTIVGLDKDDPIKQTELRLRVGNDGNVRIPMAGAVAVAGRDLGQVEDAIYNAYVPDLFTSGVSVHASVAEASTITVVVNGAARQRGLITLRSDKRNVLYALAAAEAFNELASGLVRVEPARPEREGQLYDVTNINDLRRALQAAPLESGDMIVVESGVAPAVYLTGLVNTPGPIVIDRGGRISVMQAIAAGAGLVDFLDPQEATLWRRLDNGEKVRVKLELGKILTGEAPDIALHAGDILDVPHTADTRLRQWFVENVRLGPFGMTAVYDPLADRRARIVSDNNNNALQTIFLNTLNSAIPTLINPAAP